MLPFSYVTTNTREFNHQAVKPKRKLSGYETLYPYQINGEIHGGCQNKTHMNKKKRIFYIKVLNTYTITLLLKNKKNVY